MTNKWKARDIAARIVQHHGDNARAIAGAKWNEYGAAGDFAAVELWVEVGIQVSALLNARLPLASVLDGSTTKSMMDADRVTRQEVDDLMRETKTKQRERGAARSRLGT